jgi:hypothetical protein
VTETVLSESPVAEQNLGTEPVIITAPSRWRLEISAQLTKMYDYPAAEPRGKDKEF